MSCLVLRYEGTTSSIRAFTANPSSALIEPRSIRPFSIKVGQTGIVVVRQQLPLVPAYALTLNKAQGQTLGRVLFDARRCPFSHGHTYVLFSRVRNRQSIAAVVDNRSCEEDADGGRTLVTGTVTYPELLH